MKFIIALVEVKLLMGDASIVRRVQFYRLIAVFSDAFFPSTNFLPKAKK